MLQLPYINIIETSQTMNHSQIQYPETVSTVLYHQRDSSLSKEDQITKCEECLEQMQKLEEKVQAEWLSTDEEMSTLEGQGLYFDVYLYGRQFRMDLNGVQELQHCFEELDQLVEISREIISSIKLVIMQKAITISKKFIEMRQRVRQQFEQTKINKIFN